MKRIDHILVQNAPLVPHRLEDVVMMLRFNVDIQSRKQFERLYRIGTLFTKKLGYCHICVFVLDRQKLFGDTYDILDSVDLLVRNLVIKSFDDKGRLYFDVSNYEETDDAKYVPGFGIDEQERMKKAMLAVEEDFVKNEVLCKETMSFLVSSRDFVAQN